MRIQISDARIHVEVLSDSGSPPGSRPFLLALHGGPGLDHTVLRPGIDALRDDFQVVLIDQRGHGRSDHGTSNDWTLSRWADDVAEVCDVLGVEKPIVLGVSFGAPVALTYATRHPDHPGRIIAVSGRAVQDRAACVRAFERIAGRQVAEVAARYFGDPSAENRAEYRDRCMPFLTVSRSVLTGSGMINRDIMDHWFAGEDRTFDLRDVLAGVRCPVLVVTGDSDPVAPVEMAEELVACLPPSAELAVVHRAGHGVFRDAPEQFADIIRRWAFAD